MPCILTCRAYAVPRGTSRSRLGRAGSSARIVAKDSTVHGFPARCPLLASWLPKRLFLGCFLKQLHDFGSHQVFVQCVFCRACNHTYPWLSVKKWMSANQF